jgi:anti-anti-sigma factor
MDDKTLRVAAPRMLVIKNRPALLNHLLDRMDEGYRDVVISLAHTSYIDSAGLGMLIDVHRVLVRELGGRLRLCEVNPDLRLLFEVTRLDGTLEITSEPVEGEFDEWKAPEDWTAVAMA